MLVICSRSPAPCNPCPLWERLLSPWRAALNPKAASWPSSIPGPIANRHAAPLWLLATLLTIAQIARFAALRAQDRTATFPAHVDATIRAALAQKNHEMLESAAKAAEVLQKYGLARRLLDSSLDIRAEASGQHSVDYGVRLVKIGDLERSRNNFTEADSTASRIKPGRNGLTYSFRQP